MNSLSDQQQLPNPTAVLVLGILSLVFCWCYGIIGIVVSILVILTVIVAMFTFREVSSVASEDFWRF